MSASAAKQAAAQFAAARLIEDGALVGLGSGSTTALFVRALGLRVAQGLRIRAVASSRETEAIARDVGVPLIDWTGLPADRTPLLDIAVDGADEVDAQFRMIKGGGAALVREKIVAHAAARMAVLVDPSKCVARLGAYPLPVEIVPFGWPQTRRLVANTVAGVIGRDVEVTLRHNGAAPAVSDNGNLLLDCHCEAIADPVVLAGALAVLPGVVDHGLFLGEASLLVVGQASGEADLIERPAAS